MLFFSRNGFEQQIQSNKPLLSLPIPHDDNQILLIFTAKTHLILHVYSIQNVFLLLTVHSIRYSYEVYLIQMQLPENKEYQVTFNTNKSPQCSLIFSLTSVGQQCSLYHCPATPKAKDTEPMAFVHKKLQHSEHQYEQTVQRHFSHIMP